MTVVGISSDLFREPDASRLINVWLESQASPQERSACIRFLSLLGAASSHRATSAPTKRLYPGALPSRPKSPQGAAWASPARGVQVQGLAAIGKAKDIAPRPCSSGGPDARPSPHPDAAPAAAQRPASAAAHPSVQSGAQGAGATASDWITTNEQTYGFRSLYPELYDAAASATKAVPAPNMTFKSEYSDSLKKGSGEYWKQFLVTTYETTNQSVHKPNLEYQTVALIKDRRPPPPELAPFDRQDCHSKHRRIQVRRDKGFYEWVRKEQLYYGDLLTPSAAARLDTLLAKSDAQTKTDILCGCRCLFSVLRPDKDKSMSHLVHREQRAMADPYFESLSKQVTKIKTMGHPVKVNSHTSTLPHRTKHLAQASLTAAGGALKSKPGGAPAMDVDTFQSKIPMKWAVGGGSTTSTYTDMIGSAAAQAIVACKDLVKASKPVCITCPYGSVDPVTDISRFTRFPVPESYLHRSNALFQDSERNPPETTSRMAFQKRLPEDIAKSMAFVARQVAESKKAKNKSTVPFGKGGFNIPPDWSSEKSRCYHAWEINTSENNAANLRAKLAMNGPTSSVGVTLGGRLF